MGGIIPRKVLEGESIDRSTRTADAFVDAAEALRIEQNTMRMGEKPYANSIKGTIVEGLNADGDAVPWYGVVKLGTPRVYSGGEIDENRFKRVIFLATSKSGGDITETLGIAQAPVHSGYSPSPVGRYLIDGVTQCKIKYSKEEEDGIGWATGKEGEVDYLVPNTNGQVEILWHEPMTWGSAGAQTVWALVRLTGGASKDDFIHFELKYDLAYDSLAGAEAYILTWDAENNQWDTPEDEDDVVTVVDFNVDDNTPLRGCAGKANLEVLSRGTRGIAQTRKNGDDTVYEIVQLFHKARFIEFYLNEDMTTTDEHKTAIIMVRGAKRMFWDGIDPDPAGAGFEVYNALLDGAEYLFEGSSGDKGYAVYDEHDDKYWIWVMENHGQDMSAKAQSDWDENGGDPKVSVKLCDDDGGNERGAAFDIYLPRKRAVANDYDPDVYEDDIILWNITREGTRYCTSTYLTSKIGDFRWQDAATRIPTGWKLCDDNAGGDAPDIRGRFLMMFDDDDDAEDASENDVGKSGGFRKHGKDAVAGIYETPDPADNNHDLHTKAEVAATIEAHPAHNHTLPTTVDGLASQAGSYGEALSDTVTGNHGPQGHSEHTGTGEDEESDLGHSETDNRSPFYTAALIRRYK